MKNFLFGFFAFLVVGGLAGCQQDQPKSNEPSSIETNPKAEAQDPGLSSSSGNRTAVNAWQWTVHRNGNTVKQDGTEETGDEFDIKDDKTINVTRPSGNGTLCSIVQMADDLKQLDRIILDNGTSLTKVKTQDEANPPNIFYFAELGTGRYYFLSHRVAKKVGPSIFALGKNYRVRRKKIAIYASGTIYSISIDSSDNVDIRVHQGEVIVVNSDFDPSAKKLVIKQDQRAILGQKTDPSSAIAVPDN